MHLIIQKDANMDSNLVTDIIKEDGVKDLPFAVRSYFAKALRLEREAGKTTAEAMEALDKAIAN